MIVKTLKYMKIIWMPDDKGHGGQLRLYGDNKFVKGEIFIRPTYFVSIVAVIQRIWRRPRYVVRRKK